MSKDKKKQIKDPYMGIPWIPVVNKYGFIEKWIHPDPMRGMAALVAIGAMENSKQ